MSYATAIPDQVLCLGEAMENLDGDAELLQEIVEIFVETGQAQLECIAAAVAAGDQDAVALNAHALKGGASNFCATDFVAAARDLEALARSGNLAGAGGLVARLQGEFDDVCEVAKVINWDEVARTWND